MKKIFLISLTLCISLIAVAQEKTKQRELGLVFQNLNGFGLTFKTGTNKSLWRFNTLFISGSQTDTKSYRYDTKEHTLGFGLKFGKEFRKEIVKNLEFRFGGDLSFNYSNYVSDRKDKNYFSYNNDPYKTKRNTYEPGVNMVLGINYVVAGKLVMGAEFMPFLSYVTETVISNSSNGYTYVETKTEKSGFDYGFDSSSVLLSIAYRF